MGLNNFGKISPASERPETNKGVEKVGKPEGAIKEEAGGDIDKKIGILQRGLSGLTEQLNKIHAKKITYGNISRETSGVEKTNNKEREVNEYEPSNPSRRKFLKLAGATTVTAAVGGGGIMIAKKIAQQEREVIALKEAEAFKKAQEVQEEKERQVRYEEELANVPKDVEIPTKILTRLFKGEYHSIFHNDKNKTNKFQKYNWVPEKLFTDEFFMAIQMTESRYKTNSVSKGDAYGIMQMTPIAVQDVNLYLQYVERQGLGHWPVKENISEEQIKEICQEMLKDEDTGRALGKLHFANYFNKIKIGRKAFLRGSTKQAMKELAVCYNAGSGKGQEFLAQKDESKWEGEKGDEARGYYKKAFNYMNRMSAIKRGYQDIGIVKNNSDYSTMLLTRRMDFMKATKSKSAKKNKYDWLDKKLAEIKKQEDVFGKLDPVQLQNIVEA